MGTLGAVNYAVKAVKDFAAGRGASELTAPH